MIEKILFSVVCLGLILYGAYNLIFEVEVNRCEMTYMFELPQYQKVDLEKVVRRRYPKYSLYFYGEGEYYSKYRNAKSLDGIPVLFIPGNAGSYRQVRSMGSVALRMAESLRKPFYFNYFSADFNEELSAFSGSLIEQQTHFIVECIKTILSKYKPDTSVVVIGHSIGGVVARNLFLVPGFKPELVDTIITQSSPHRLPVFAADAAMHALYQRLDRLWRRPHAASLRSVALVSLAGGQRDVQVRSGLGDLSALSATHSRAVWGVTSAVRAAWASTDHLCAVWCRQIVLALNRALFELTDASMRRLRPDPAARAMVFRRHLLVRPAGRAVGAETALDGPGRWLDKTGEQRFSFTRDQAETTFFVKFGPFSGREALRAILVVTEVKAPWLFLCRPKTPDGDCSRALDVTSWAVEAPPSELHRRVVHLDRRLFTDHHDDAFLVARIGPTKKEVEVFYERYEAARRHLTHDPGVVDFLLDQPGLSGLHRRMLLPETEPGAVYYRVALPDLFHVRQGLEVRVRVISCAATAGSVGLISLRSPWDGYFIHESIWYYSNASLNLQLATTRPSDYERNAEVELLLDPTCRYRVFLHHSLGAMMSQFVRVYPSLLPAYLLVHILSGLGLQLLGLVRGEAVKSVLVVKGSVPLVLPSLVLGYVLNSSFLSSAPLPKTDLAVMQEEGLWFPLVMQLLFVVAIALFVLACAICRLLVEIVALPLCGQGRRLPCRIVGRLVGTLTAFVAIYVALRICSGLAALVLFVGQLLLTALDRARKDQVDSFRIRFTVLLLLALLSLVNAPSVVVWLKILIDNAFTRLPPPVGDGSVPMATAFAFLSLARADLGSWAQQAMMTRAAAYIVMVTAVGAPLFASFAFHRLSWGIGLSLSAVAFNSLVCRLISIKKRPKTD